MQGIYYESNDGTSLKIGMVSKFDDYFDIIKKDLDVRGIRPHYYRYWGDEKEMTVDYGSWSTLIKVRKEEP